MAPRQENIQDSEVPEDCASGLVLKKVNGDDSSFMYLCILDGIYKLDKAAN